MVAARVVSDGANWTCISYDARGRVVTIAYPAVIGAAARTVTYTYTYTYNTTTTPLTTTVSDPTGTITTVTDLLGRTSSYTDSKGVVTTTSYDQAGRLQTPLHVTHQHDAQQQAHVSVYANCDLAL